MFTLLNIRPTSTEKTLHLLKELPMFPIVSDNPLRQTLDASRLREVQNLASAKFPDIVEDDVALEMYACMFKTEGVFYRGEDGQRYVVGPDLNYFVDKNYTDQPSFYSFRHLMTTMHEKRSAYIDRPRPAEDQAVVAHCCEKEWNVPVGDARHLMSLPAEILRYVLELCLTVHKRASIRPCIFSNYDTRYFKEQTFNIINPDKSWCSSKSWCICKCREKHPFVSVSRHDDDGPYIELRRVARAAIDATCLRACKTFNTIGRELLYGQNNFYFNFMNCYPASDLEIASNRNHVVSDDPSLEKHPIVCKRIQKIQDQVPLKDCGGWNDYLDPFSRFLWMIGPTSTSEIRSLSFNCMIKLHECSVFTCEYEECSDCMLECLRYYLPFIIACCPNLRKLTIYTEEDVCFDGTPAEFAKIRNQVLAPFLEENMLRIPELEDLNVFDGLDTMQRLACAEHTRKLLKERVKRRADDAWENRVALQNLTTMTVYYDAEVPSGDPATEVPVIESRAGTSMTQSMLHKLSCGLYP